MKTLLTFGLLVSLAWPALANVKISNTTGENLKVEITSHSPAGTNSPLNSGTTGADFSSTGETTVVVKSDGGSELCRGTFAAGSELVVKKDGGYKIVKK